MERLNSGVVIMKPSQEFTVSRKVATDSGRDSGGIPLWAVERQLVDSDIDDVEPFWQ